MKSDQIEFKEHYMEYPQKGYFMIKFTELNENRAVTNLYMLSIIPSICTRQN